MGGTMTVYGGRPLYGTVRTPAAKNSVLPLLAASVLCGTAARLDGVPPLSDVEDCLAILRALGCTAYRDGADIVAGGRPACCRLPAAPAARMRASILFAAPLLARLGRVETALPGGCKIGARPIDLHLAGLLQMGAQISPAAGGRLVLTAPHGLHGAEICLPFPSVGATETLLLAAAAAHGRSVLHGAAKEPEIADLARFINRCGGHVEGAGSGELVIEGGGPLHGVSFAPIPDRIWASTLACAVAAAHGCVRITGCPADSYAPVLDILARAGCHIERAAQGSEVSVACFGRLRGAGQLVTGVYPGLATDAAPLVAAALLAADGESRIEDRIFENRFGCAAGFAQLGAAVRVEGRTLHIGPAPGLRGAQVAAPDLRGGAALVIAALGAAGTSRVSSCEYIERGYAGLGAALSSLGARIG